MCDLSAQVPSGCLLLCWWSPCFALKAFEQWRQKCDFTFCVGVLCVLFVVLCWAADAWTLCKLKFRFAFKPFMARGKFAFCKLAVRVHKSFTRDVSPVWSFMWSARASGLLNAEPHSWQESLSCFTEFVDPLPALLLLQLGFSLVWALRSFFVWNDSPHERQANGDSPVWYLKERKIQNWKQNLWVIFLKLF